MKWITSSVCGGALLFLTGCLSSHEEWRGHAFNSRYVEGMAGPPASEVAAPSRQEPGKPVIRIERVGYNGTRK